MTGVHIFDRRPPFFHFREGAFIAVFVVLIIFFSCTSFIARWYVKERTARAEAYYEQGQQLAQEGDGNAAIEQYRNALSIVRDNRSYRLAIAEGLFKLGKYSEAAIYFRELLRDDPVNAVPNLMLARIDAAQGHLPAAIDSYHRAIFGYWPDDAEANRQNTRWELVNLLAKSHTNDNEVLAELLELAGEPSNDLAARKKIGRMLLQYGSAAQSAAVFRDILRVTRRDADAYAGYGEAELALGNYRDAQTAFRRALHVNPHDDAAEKRLETVDETLALDPTARNLSPAGRYSRSKKLVARAVADITPCLQNQQAPSTELEQAQAALTNKIRAGAYTDAAETNIDLAEQLWGMRTTVCGSKIPNDEPLSRVLAHLSR